MIKLSDLRVRDVVNVADGKRLGLLCDIEIDLDSGRISALVLPGSTRLFGLFGHDRDIVVPWRDVVRVGEDVILVDVPVSPSPLGPGAVAGTLPSRGEVLR